MDRMINWLTHHFPNLDVNMGYDDDNNESIIEIRHRGERIAHVHESDTYIGEIDEDIYWKLKIYNEMGE